MIAAAALQGGYRRELLYMRRKREREREFACAAAPGSFVISRLSPFLALALSFWKGSFFSLFLCRLLHCERPRPLSSARECRFVSGQFKRLHNDPACSRIQLLSLGCGCVGGEGVLSATRSRAFLRVVLSAEDIIGPLSIVDTFLRV